MLCFFLFPPDISPKSFDKDRFYLYFSQFQGKKLRGYVWRFQDFCVLLQSTNRRFVHYNVTTLRMANMNEVNFDILVNRIEEDELAKRFRGNKTLSKRSLQLYRQFYLTYPHLAKQISKYLNRTFSIVQSPIAQLQLVDKEENTIGQSVTAQFKDDKNECFFEGTKPNLLFNKLSFTHLAALLPLSCRFRPRNEWQNF